MQFWPTAPLVFPAQPIALSQLGQQVRPFVLELAGREVHSAVAASPVPDLGTVERVSSGAGLVEDARQVAVDRAHGIAAVTETFELRVVPIADSPAGEHSAGEQALAPERHQPRAIG